MRKLLGAVALAAAVGWAGPALAQDGSESDVEALVDASASPEGAIASAKRQETDGDLTGAAATLERALMAAPRSETLRLAYVALLCRLDDRQRAAIELAKADKGDGTAIAACGALQPIVLAGGGVKSGWRGQLTLGLDYDSNASGAINIEFDVPGFNTPKEDGFAVVAAGALKGRLAVGRNVFVYGSADALLHSDIAGPHYNYKTGSLAAGVGVRSGGIELSAGAVVRHWAVNGLSYLTEVGGEGQAVLRFGQDARLTVHALMVDQRYLDGIFFSRDGTRYDGSIDLQGGGPDRFSYIVGGGWEDKKAETDFLAYRGYRGYAAVRVPLGGVYGLLGGTARRIDYTGDPFGFFSDVKETRLYGRAGLGIPLGKGFTAEAAGTWTKRDYNEASGYRDYTSYGAQLRLTFNFGSREEGR